MWVPWSCCASSCVVFLACTSAVPSRRRSRRPRRVEAPEAPMLLRTRHSCELCLFQYMSSSFLSTSVDSRLAISITRVYRHEICKRHTGVLAVPCRLRALCAAAASGLAAAAIPYLFTPCLPRMCVALPEMALPRRAVPAGRGC